MRDTLLETARTRAARHTLGEYLELCEENYWLLDLLLQGVEYASGQQMVHVGGGLDLQIRVVEHTPYTTLFEITYRAGTAAFPKLQVRAFHDARVCEVLAWSEGGRPVQVRDGAGPATASELERRWQVNRLLGKWIEYLLGQGVRLNLRA